MEKPEVEKQVWVKDCQQGAVRAVRFNSDGNYCLTCGNNKTLKLWNPHKGILLKTYSGHGYDVLDAQGSLDNCQLCSCGMDKSVILWDVATGNILRKFRGHASHVNCVKFNLESTVILSGSNDNTVKAWDCRTRKNDPIQTLDDPKDTVTSIAVSDHEILVSSADCRVRRYDLRIGKMHVDFLGKPVSSVSFTQDQQCYLASTLDSTLRLMDAKSGEMLNEYTGHCSKEYQTDCCISPSDEHIFSGSEDGCVYIWSLLEAKIIRKLDHGVKSAVHSICHHPEDACLLTANANKVYMWKSHLAQVT